MRRRTPLVVVSALLLVTLLLGNCAGPGSAAASGETYFPRWTRSGDVVLGQLAGRLATRDDCIVLITEGPREVLPLWDDTYFSLADGDPPSILYAGGELEIGQHVILGGGVLEGDAARQEAERLTGDVIPEACRAPAYLVAHGVSTAEV